MGMYLTSIAVKQVEVPIASFQVQRFTSACLAAFRNDRAAQSPSESCNSITTWPFWLYLTPAVICLTFVGIILVAIPISWTIWVISIMTKWRSENLCQRTWEDAERPQEDAKQKQCRKYHADGKFLCLLNITREWCGGMWKWYRAAGGCFPALAVGDSKYWVFVRHECTVERRTVPNHDAC